MAYFCRSKKLFKKRINDKFSLCLDGISTKRLSPFLKELVRGPRRTSYFPIRESSLLNCNCQFDFAIVSKLQKGSTVDILLIILSQDSGKALKSSSINNFRKKDKSKEGEKTGGR